MDIVHTITSQFVDPDAQVVKDFVGRTFHLSYLRLDLFRFMNLTEGFLDFGNYPGVAVEDQFEAPLSCRSFIRFEVKASPAVLISPPGGAPVRAGEWVSPWACNGACKNFDILLDRDVQYTGSVLVSVLRPLRETHLGVGVVVDPSPAEGLHDGSNRSFYPQELSLGAGFHTASVGGSCVHPESGP